MSSGVGASSASPTRAPRLRVAGEKGDFTPKTELAALRLPKRHHAASLEQHQAVRETGRRLRHLHALQRLDELGGEPVVLCVAVSQLAVAPAPERHHAARLQSVRVWLIIP